MLTEEEGYYLAADEDGEMASEYELRIAESLISFGRAEWRCVGVAIDGDGDECDHLRLFTLPMGEKALRIDAIIRQWGYQP